MPSKGSSSTKVAKSRPVLKQLRLPEELYDELELRADVTGEKVSDLVRRVLNRYCEGPFERLSDVR
ncbi:MAG: hypothetical protein JW384_04234 [Nitrosomonadaceae bacterium]|nr:hypothetical protein [Nitrosomonadaceae bacterium]